MKRFLTPIAVIFIALAIPAFPEEEIGTLNIYSKIPDAKIYINDDFLGYNKVNVDKIRAGSLLVRAIKNDELIFEESVNIYNGRITTVFITENNRTGKGKPVYGRFSKDYGKYMNNGWFLKAGHVTNIYRSTQLSTLDRYGTSLGIGIGFQIPIAPKTDFILTLDRADLSSSSASWFYMPVTANIQFSYLPNPYFRGKQYFGLGLGYYMTNLRSALMEDLTSFGYHLYYGLEIPTGPYSAVYFDLGYQASDINRYNYMMQNQYIAAGYRFFIDQ